MLHTREREHTGRPGLENVFHEVTNRWNKCRIRDISQDPDIWFNKLFNLNPKFKKIKAKYEKYEYEIKEHVFDILSENYKQVRVSYNVNI